MFLPPREKVSEEATRDVKNVLRGERVLTLLVYRGGNPHISSHPHTPICPIVVRMPENLEGKRSMHQMPDFTLEPDEPDLDPTLTVDRYME